MKRLIAGGLYLAVPILIGSPQFAAAQMHMAMTTLLVAQLDAKQVVGGSASTATGTGAFLLDAAHKTLAYNLTYEGLSSDGAKSIALHNFGSGKNGETIKVLCGGDAKPCPKFASATISGRFESGDGRAIDNKLLGEFGSERVYVEIAGADGKPEIRGQLSPNQAMVRVSNYIVNLVPAAGTNSKGTGTAIVSETYLPDGKVSVFYAATVASTAGAPTNVAMVAGQTSQARTFSAQAALPKMELRSAPNKKNGGSLSGVYEINSAKPAAPFAARLMTNAAGQPGLVVTTNEFPKGELFGALVPVR